MTEPSPPSLEECWDIARRGKWLILVCILSGLSIAVVLCIVLPKSYRSTTLILVEEQKIPENYVKGIVGASVQERLTMIEQQVKSRTLLTQVALDFNLIRNQSEPEEIEGVVETLRRAIEVKTQGGRLGSVEAFTISFSHEDPVIARSITARLASKFMQENVRHREQFVEGAAEFLDHELSRAREVLERQEAEISAFKTRHMGELPEQMDANLRTLDRLQEEHFRIGDAMRGLQDELAAMEKGIGEYTETGKASSALATVDPEMKHLFERLKDLEKRRAILAAEYTESYPDVILTKKEIEEIRTQLEETYGDDNATESGMLDPYLRELTKRREDINRELVHLREKRAEIGRRIQAYEDRVEKAPRLEQQLLILLRDYENTKENYASLLKKRLDARIAENLESRQKGEQFRVIDPPNLPAKPVKPNKPVILLLGLAGGCGLGYGLAYTLESRCRKFRRSEDIEVFLGRQPLAAIPDFSKLYDRTVRERLLSASATAEETPSKNGKRKAAAGAAWPRRNGPKQDVPKEWNLVMKWLPSSVVAEQYRLIATRLSLLDAARSSCVIEVTSAVKGEGKTTTAINLAYALGRDLGRRTALVDCDFKSPAVREYMGKPPGLGLHDVLNGNAALERVLSQVDDAPCWVLPAGSQSHGAFSLSKIHELQQVLDDLRSKFEYIVINTPPVLPLADMSALGVLADLLLLVARAGSTSRETIQQALNVLGDSKPVHVVLNAVEMKTMPYYMHYEYEHVGSKEEDAPKED